MKNQHKLIKGYRDLSQQEIELINTIKGIGLQLDNLISEVNDHRDSCTDLTLDKVESRRCADIAKKDLQTGIMWLTRSVALPQGF